MLKSTTSRVVLFLFVGTATCVCGAPPRVISDPATAATRPAQQGANLDEGDDYLKYSIPANAYKVGPDRDKDPSFLVINYLNHAPSPKATPWNDDGSRIVGQEVLLAETKQLVKRELFIGERKRHGVQREWHDDGTPKSEEPYRNGIMHGVFKYWDEKGQLVGCYKMVNGTGVRKIYYPNGRLREERHYRDGQMRSIECELHDNGQIWALTEHSEGASERKCFLFAPNGELYQLSDLYRNISKNMEALLMIQFDDGKVTKETYRDGFNDIPKKDYVNWAQREPKVPRPENDPNDYKKRVDERVREIVKKYKEMPPVKIPLECPKEEAK